MRFRLSDAPIDPATLREELGDVAAGAFCCFEGWVRNVHVGRAVQGLRYSAHPILALAQGQGVLQRALDQFEVLDARVVHRLGNLELGELAVWVGVTAMHRDAAFVACRKVLLLVPSFRKRFFLRVGTDDSLVKDTSPPSLSSSVLKSENAERNDVGDEDVVRRFLEAVKGMVNVRSRRAWRQLELISFATSER